MRAALIGALLATSTAFVGPTAAEAQTQLKVAYINSEAILAQAPGARAAMDQFQRELADMQAELQPRAQELDQMIADYQAQALALSDTAKSMREQAIQQKDAQLQQEAAGMQQQAEARQQQLLQPVMDRISEVIEAVRVEGEYALVFDAAAGGLVAADPELDLTETVIARLQAGAAGTSGTGGN